MRDCHYLKARGKDVNQASQDPNAPKKKPSYGMGIGEITITALMILVSVNPVLIVAFMLLNEFMLFYSSYDHFILTNCSKNEYLKKVGYVGQCTMMLSVRFLIFGKILSALN